MPLLHGSVRAALGTADTTRPDPEVDATSVCAARLQAHRHRDEQQQRWEGREVKMRIALTELVQSTVEALKRQVSEDLLTGLPRT